MAISERHIVGKPSLVASKRRTVDKLTLSSSVISGIVAPSRVMLAPRLISSRIASLKVRELSGVNFVLHGNFESYRSTIQICFKGFSLPASEEAARDWFIRTDNT